MSSINYVLIYYKVIIKSDINITLLIFFDIIIYIINQLFDILTSLLINT